MIIASEPSSITTNYIVHDDVGSDRRRPFTFDIENISRNIYSIRSMFLIMHEGFHKCISSRFKFIFLMQ